MMKRLPLFFCLLLLLPSVAPFVLAASPTNTTFVVVSSIWGTSSSPVEVGPGSQNVLLTLSIEYTGGVQATAVQAILRLPAGITDVYGNSAPQTGTTGVSANSIFGLTYSLNIANEVPLGTYSVPIQFTWTTNAGGNFVTSGETDSFAVNVLGTPTLTYQNMQSSLKSGQINNVAFTLSNTGTGAATRIQTTVSSSSVSVLNVQPTISTLAPSSSFPLNVSLFVPTSAAGSSVTLSFTASYTDSYGFSKTATQTLALYAVSVAVPVLQFQTTQVSLIPGRANNVTVALVNLGPGAVSRVFTSVSAPAQFSVLNQVPMIASLGANSSAQVILGIYAPLTTAGSSLTLTFTATYIDSYGNSRTASQTAGLSVISLTTIVSGTALSVVPTSNTLTAGEESPVSVLVKNTGLLPIYSPSFSFSVSQPLVVSANSSYSFPGLVLEPGQSVAYHATVVSGLDTPGGYYRGLLTLIYLDESGSNRNVTASVGLVLVQPIAQISVRALSTEVSVGGDSTVSFVVSNTGSVPMASPTFSLTVPSALAVTSNASYSLSGLVLNPGQSTRYDVTISNGPKTSEGAYVSTLTVTYSDKFGVTHTSSFPVGLVAVGTIQLVIEDEQVVQTQNGVEVSGTLLNEGTASAFYAQVSANLTSPSASGSASQYVGEIDTNTPLPFSVTISHPPVDSKTPGRVLLFATYQNDFGKVMKVDLPSSAVELLSPQQLAQQQSSLATRTADQQTRFTGLPSLYLIVVAVIVIVGIALYVRRRRKSAAAKPTGSVKENKVF